MGGVAFSQPRIKEWLVILLLPVLFGCRAHPKNNTKSGAPGSGSPVQAAKAAEEQRWAKIPTREYPFHNYEWTGQCLYARVNGKDVPIGFDAHSNRLAMDSMDSLKPEIYVPNERGRMIIVGKLDPKPTPLPSWDKNPGAADPPGSVYHAFRLEHWYLRVPFDQDVSEPMADADKRKMWKREHLRRTDFDPRHAWHPGVNLDTPEFNPADFERPSH